MKTIGTLLLLLLTGCATSKPNKPTVSQTQAAGPVVWSSPRFSPDGTRLAGVRNGTGVSEFALPQDLAGHEVVLPFAPNEGGHWEEVLATGLPAK